MPEYLPSLTKEEHAWLLKLMQEIWKPPQERRNPREAAMPREIERKCTQEEIDKLFLLIKTRHLVCTLSHHGWFNGVMLNVYDQASDADDQPRYILSLYHQHLDMPGVSREECFKKAFEIFNEIATTPTNLQFLTFYGLEKPKPRVHYEY